MEMEIILGASLGLTALGALMVGFSLLRRGNGASVSVATAPTLTAPVSPRDLIALASTAHASVAVRPRVQFAVPQPLGLDSALAQLDNEEDELTVPVRRLARGSEYRVVSTNPIGTVKARSERRAGQYHIVQPRLAAVTGGSSSR